MTESKTAIKRKKYIRDRGVPEVYELVASDKLSLYAGTAFVMYLSKDDQSKFVKRGIEAVRQKAKDILKETKKGLTVGQRVIIAEQTLTSDEKSGESGEVAQKIADKIGGDVRQVYRVFAVRNKGVPEVMMMFTSGKLSLWDANKFVQNVPKSEQSEIVKGGPEAVKQKVKEMGQTLRVAGNGKSYRMPTEEGIINLKRRLKEQQKGEEQGQSCSTHGPYTCNECGCWFVVGGVIHAPMNCPECGTGKENIVRDKL